MATQLKNVKFGQAVLCSKDTTNLQEFDLTHVNLSGGSFIGGHFLNGTSCGGTICGGSVTTDSLSFATSGGVLCGKGGTIDDVNISGSTICGGSVTTDSFAFASCGGTFCGCGGTISDVRICGGSITTDSFAFASCGGRFFGNGGTIDLGSGYLDNAIIGSSCRISGATLDYPTVCGGSLSDVTIDGSITGIVNVCGNGQLHLYGNNCIDFTSGGWMQMHGVKYTPQVSGNQLIFVQV